MKTCMSIILALLLCTLSGCGEMNTCIGWPWTYWHHGFFPVVGFLVIYLLLLAYWGLFCALAEECQPALLWTVVVLVEVGLVLQMLPPTTSGIQFIPLPPWHYGGWIARIISAAVWLCLAATCTDILLTTTNAAATAQDRCACGFGFFMVLCLNALLSFATPIGVNLPDQPPAQSEPGQDQITQWERRKEERAEALAKLLSDKEALVARIRSLGARDKRELMTHKIGQTLMEEFEELARQIATVRREVDAIETMTERAKSRMRSLEREALLRGTKVTDEEYRKLCGTDHVLEEELRRRAGEKTPGSEVQLDKLLDEVFAKER